MRLAFSIPVHENNDVIADLLRNIFLYNPGSYAVLRVSTLFTDFDAGRFEKMPNVFINPKRNLSRHGKGMLLGHCANFRHLQQARGDWDYFCISSSNEMFIRPGLKDYISQTRNGFQAVRFDVKNGWHIFSRRVDQHPKICELLSRLGTGTLYGGQTEGQFYEKAVFDKIADTYLSVFGETEINDFETEEVVPQTVAMAMGIKPALPFTLVDYSHTDDFRLSVKNLAVLADPKLTGRVRLNLGEVGRYMLASPHLDTDNRSVFAVKRVPREIDHPLRKFINGLPAPDFASSDSNAKVAEQRPRSMVPLVPNLCFKQVLRGIRRCSGWIFPRLRMRYTPRARARALVDSVRSQSKTPKAR